MDLGSIRAALRLKICAFRSHPSLTIPCCLPSSLGAGENDKLGGCLYAEDQATINLDFVDAIRCTVSSEGAETGLLAEKGGAIFCHSCTLSVTNSIMSSSRASIGGTFYLDGEASASVVNVTVTDSRCVLKGCAGGAMEIEGNTRLVVRESTFQDCVAPEGFGGAMSDGTTAVWQVFDSLFLRNDAGYGGAVYNGGSSNSTFTRCRFVNNTANNNGGAIKPSTNALVKVFDSYFEGNKAASNAAVGPNSECPQPENGIEYCISFVRCTFYKNYASSVAGAMALDGSSYLEDVLFDSNGARDSAGALYIHVDVPMVLKNLTFVNNIAPNGAGIFIEGTATYVFDGAVNFTNNIATYASIDEPSGVGAGFAMTREARVIFNGPALFQGGIAGIGAGIHVSGEAIVIFNESVSFIDNHATANGGALWLGGSARVLFEEEKDGLELDHVFLRNSAVSNGGAIYHDAASNIATSGLTLIGNSATYGGGYAASATVTNCPVLGSSKFTNNSASILGGGIYMGSTVVNCNGTVCPFCSYSGNKAPLGADDSGAPFHLNPISNIPSSVSAAEGFSAVFTLLDASRRIAASNERVIMVDIIDWSLPDGKMKNSTLSSPPTNSGSRRADLEGSFASDAAEDDSPIILRGPNVAYFIENQASFGFLKVSGPPGSNVTLRFRASPSVPTVYTVKISIAFCQKGYESFHRDRTYYCLKQNIVSRTTQIVIVVCAGVCILLGLMTLIWLIVNRHRAAIRRSSALFCILTTIGAIFMFVSAIMWVFVTNATCALRVWLLVIGFVLCYGSVFVKEYRLWLIFDDKDLKSTVRVTDSSLLKVVLGGLFVELLIVMIWFIVTPFLKRVVVDLAKEEIAYRCTSLVTPAFFWIVFALNMCILLIGCILAWLARNVPSNFNEAKQILFAIYNVAIIAIIVVILASVFRSSSEAVSLTVSIGLLFSSLVTLAILFIPKVRHVANKAAVRREILKEIAQLERDVQWKKRMLQDVRTEASSGTAKESAGSHST